MKRIFLLVFAISVVGSYVGAEVVKANFDGVFTGVEKPCNLSDAIRNIPTTKPITPMPSPDVSRALGLTTLERQNILLSLNHSEWISSSGYALSFWWTPRKFTLVGGVKLLVDVYSSAMGTTSRIPLKVNDDIYEYGPWTYSHCSPTMTQHDCFYDIKVKFQVISESALEGTMQVTRPSGTETHDFVYYKQDSNKLYQGFAEYEGGQFGRKVFSQPKSIPQVNCWEDNCRMETACGKIKSCNRKCQLLGVACGVAGTSITLYYTGNTQPTLASLIGGFANVGCNAACEDWACSDIPDCKPVKKCDTHCVTTSASGDLVNVNTGQVIYQ